jgi:hypothetical protein
MSQNPRSANTPPSVPTTADHPGRRRAVFEPGRFNGEDGAKLTREQIRFANAMRANKLETRQPNPTFSQTWDVAMAVARSLGYRLVAEPVEA